jgi:hypothetical protein
LQALLNSQIINGIDNNPTPTPTKNPIQKSLIFLSLVPIHALFSTPPLLNAHLIVAHRCADLLCFLLPVFFLNPVRC